MINNNFLITLVSMFAVLFAIFTLSPKKEGYSTSKYGHYLDSKYSESNNAMNLEVKPANALGPFSVPQATVVGATNVNDTRCAEYAFNRVNKVCPNAANRGVTAGRNVQALLAPRGGGLVNQSKLSRVYDNVPTPSKALIAGQPMASACKDGVCDMVKSDFGKVTPTPTVKESYEAYPDTTDMLPVTDMCDVNVFGSETQPVVYDRLMFSNIRSRLRGAGDYIRGDLAIVPDNYKPGNSADKHDNWFQVSVKPERDLNAGAMRYISRELEDISAMYGKQVGSLRDTTLSAAQGDVEIVTFGN